MYRKLQLFCLLVFTPSIVLAQSSGKTIETPDITTSTFIPNVSPVLSIVSTETPVEVDGNLDDAAWRTAAHATNFSETFPDDQTKPPIGIDAWVTYDQENVYFAFKIQDDPRSIRSNMSDRDNIWQDDYVGVMLDTYGDHGWAYFLAANPIGVQGDTRLLNNGGEDMQFNIVFKSEGKLTADGYQVEMAVPFRSLRFPSRDVQTWKINFWITHPREDRNTYSWVAMDRDDSCFLCQMADAPGVTDVSPGRNLELLPALTGSQSGAIRSFDNPADGFNNDRVSADLSLGLKYSFSSNLTADVAVNPDFSQIEADAAQVDVNSTFSLFFPERRPFFQEGSNLFNTWINAVYTRSINNPVSAAKLTGRAGRNSFGYIGGYDQNSPITLPFEESSAIVEGGESVSNIFRFQRTFGTSSSIGALVTDRRLVDGGSGSTASIDGLFRLTKTLQIESQVVFSNTVEDVDPEAHDNLVDRTFNEGKHTAAFDGESFSGVASYISLERNARHYSADFDFWSTSPSFRAANGFVTQNNIQRFSLYQQYTFYMDGIVKRITPSAILGYERNFQGERKDQYLWLGLHMSAAAQTNINVNYLVKSDELFRGIDFKNLRRIGLNVNSNFSNVLRLGAFVGTGRTIARNAEVPEMGKNFDFEVWGTLKPSSRLVIQPVFTYASLNDIDSDTEFFSGYILRTRFNYQFNRQFFLRVVTQYNDFNDRYEIDPLLTYKINPFTAFYLGSTHDITDFEGTTGFYQTSRQFFFKFQYLVRA